MSLWTRLANKNTAQKLTARRMVAHPILVLLLFGLAPACSFSASVEAGSKSPDETPPAAAPSEPAATPASTPDPAAPPKANVKVAGNKLEAPGAISFQPDTAVLATGAGNEAVLGEIKAYLEQNVRVTRVRIEGHTHNLRPTDQSLQLSGQRALTVKQWLRENGIHEGRLLAVGFGDAKPTASNTDAAGQAQNERIDFRIAELDGKPYLGPDPLAGGTEFP